MINTSGKENAVSALHNAATVRWLATGCDDCTAREASTAGDGERWDVKWGGGGGGPSWRCRRGERRTSISRGSGRPPAACGGGEVLEGGGGERSARRVKGRRNGVRDGGRRLFKRTEGEAVIGRCLTVQQRSAARMWLWRSSICAAADENVMSQCVSRFRRTPPLVALCQWRKFHVPMVGASLSGGQPLLASCKVIRVDLTRCRRSAAVSLSSV